MQLSLVTPLRAGSLSGNPGQITSFLPARNHRKLCLCTSQRCTSQQNTGYYVTPAPLPVQMTTPKGCMVRQRIKGRSGPCGVLSTLLCATLLRPVPFFLTPEALYTAASWTAYILAVLVYQTAVLTIPLALWLAASSFGGSTLQLPPAVLQALPALIRVQLPTLPPPHVALAGLLAFLLVLRAAERTVRRAASERAANAAHALRPGQLEQYYAGWQMPDSRAPKQGLVAEDAPAASEGNHALQVGSVVGLGRAW
jgi:hypothetical protein